MPPGLPCRPLVEQAARLAMPHVRVEHAAKLAMPAPRGASRQACHAGCSRGACRQACHAGTSCGASRQACHAGGRAGRATQSPTVRDFQRHLARTPARSTSSRPLSSHLRVLRVLRGLLFSVSSVFSVVCFSPCPLWFVFPVPSVSCPMWGRLSSLRPAFQPALVPFTHRPTCNRTVTTVGADQPVRPFSSDLGALPCSRKGAVPRGASRQACHAGGRAGRATQSRPCTGVPTPSGPHDSALHLNPPPLFPSPCSPCPPWFVFLRVLRVLRGLFFSVSSVVCFSCALRVVSDVGQAF